MPLEVISTSQLLSRSRYPDGAYLDNRLRWAREDTVALQALCAKKSNLSKSAASLGRTPTSIAHRAAYTGLRMPYEWRDAITTYKRKPCAERPRQLLAYPFLVDTSTPHAELLAVNSLVPKGIPDHIRGDICQELLLAIYEGSFSLNEVRSDPSIIRRFVRKNFSTNYEGAGFAWSLDKPMQDGRSWYDVLPEPEHNETILALEDLGTAFPSVVRSSGKARGDKKSPIRYPDKCPHARFRWEACELCDAEFEKLQAKHEEYRGW